MVNIEKGTKLDNRVHVTKLLLDMRRHVQQVRKCYEQQYESLDRSYVSRQTEQAYEDVFHKIDSIEDNVEAVLYSNCWK